MPSPREILSTLRACKTYVDSIVVGQHVPPNMNESSNASSNSYSLDTISVDLFEKTQKMLKSFIDTSESFRMTQTESLSIKEVAILLFNSAKTFSQRAVHICGATKYISGLALCCINFDRFQCSSVFESAAKTFMSFNDTVHANDAYDRALSQLEGISNSPKKNTMVVNCLLGSSKCRFISSSSSSLNKNQKIQQALIFVQSGTSLPLLDPEDCLRLQEFALSIAAKLACDDMNHDLALEWLVHCLSVHRQTVYASSPSFINNNSNYSSRSSSSSSSTSSTNNTSSKSSNKTPKGSMLVHLNQIASSCMLIQTELQLFKNDINGAEATVREHKELHRQHDSLFGSSSGKFDRRNSLLSSSSILQISKQDRWNKCYLNIAAKRKDLAKAKASLDDALQFARETCYASATKAAATTTTASDAPVIVTSPLIGKRLKRFLDMATLFANLMGWSTESLIPFMELASIATHHSETMLDESMNDMQTFQEQINQRQTIYLDVMRRIMMELLNEHRNHGVNVTIQMMQVYSTIQQHPVSRRGRKVLTSILAEYGTLLYHSKRWADGQTIMNVLLASLKHEQEKQMQQQRPQQQNLATPYDEINESDASSIESVHHMLAEILSSSEQHELAVEETKHIGTSFDAHHLRFRVLLRKLIASSRKTTEVENEGEKMEEENAMYDVLLRTSQDCMLSNDLTERGLLSIAHVLQKHGSAFPKLRFILCDVLTKACKLISVKSMGGVLNDSIIRGQIFSNMMSLLSELTNEDERLHHVASTMQNLLISIKKYCCGNNEDIINTSNISSSTSSSSGSSGSSNNIGTCSNTAKFITINDLRTCLRCALAVTHASYCSYSSVASYDGENKNTNDEGNDCNRLSDMRITLLEQIYKHVQSIQQITNYEELSNCRIYIMRAHLNLRRSVYNQEDVLRHLKFAKQTMNDNNGINSGIGNSTTTLTVRSTCTTDEEIVILKCMIATSEFILCARNHLPGSENETILMLEKFAKQHVLANSCGFFDRLAEEASKCTSSPHVPMRALLYELECRRRTCLSSRKTDSDGSRKNKSGSVGGGNDSSSKADGFTDPQAPLHIAQCFRRLIDMCLDNNQKIKLLNDALCYSRQLNGCFTSITILYPEDELRWLLATAWNSGLSCMKVGDQQCGEQYLGVAIKFGQLPVPRNGIHGRCNGGSDVGCDSQNILVTIAGPEELEDMTNYYSDQDFKIVLDKGGKRKLV